MSDDRYVHDPATFEGGESASAGADADSGNNPFDRRNWLLVGLIVVAFLVVPVLIAYQPVRVNSFMFTYLVLPFGLALLLGAAAVWATVR